MEGIDLREEDRFVFLDAGRSREIEYFPAVGPLGLFGAQLIQRRVPDLESLRTELDEAGRWLTSPSARVFLHVIGPGSEQGLALPSGEHCSWRELGEELRGRLGAGCERLFLMVAAPVGAQADDLADAGGTAPFALMIGAARDL